MNQWKIGDVVQLKSGGPLMTVAENGYSEGSVLCFWFVGLESVAEKVFRPETLRAAE